MDRQAAGHGVSLQIAGFPTRNQQNYTPEKRKLRVESAATCHAVCFIFVRHLQYHKQRLRHHPSAAQSTELGTKKDLALQGTGAAEGWQKG